jgi:hypothetical protein
MRRVVFGFVYGFVPDLARMARRTSLPGTHLVRFCTSTLGRPPDRRFDLNQRRTVFGRAICDPAFWRTAMTSFIVEPLARDQIRAVYPLIREAIPGLSLAAWLRFAQAATAARRGSQSGIIVARREGHDFPNGLFCYRVDRDPALGKILVAEHFVAVDLLHPDEVLAALVAELDALGKRLGCKAVRSIVHGADVEGGLAQAGHANVGSILGKLLPENAAPTVAGRG